jgi:O-antigen/teichoic acid export membrane protein
MVPVSMPQRLHRHLAGLRRRPLVRDGLWVAAGHATTAASGLVSIRLFTELAPQSVFGAANLLIGILVLGMHALLAPITQTQIRYHTAYSDAGDGDAYTWLMARLAVGAAAAIIALVTAILLLWPEARAGAGVSVIAWLAAWVAVMTCRNVLIARVQAERRQKRYALWIGAEAVLTLACTGATLALWPTVQGFVAGQLAGVAMAAAAFGVPTAMPRATARIDVTRLHPAAWRQIIDYGLAFAPLGLLGWVSNLSDRYVLAANLDVTTVGLYAAAFGIASRPAVMIGGVLTDIFRAPLFLAQNRGDRSGVSRYFRAWVAGQLLASGATFLAFGLAGDLICNALLAEAYRDGAREILISVAAAYCVLTLSFPLENRLLAMGVSRALLLPKAIGAIFNVAAAIFIIPRYGALGAALANVAGQAALLSFSFLILWVVLGIHPANEALGVNGKRT